MTGQNLGFAFFRNANRIPLYSSIVVLLGLILPAPAGAQTNWDHSKVVGPQKCAECHKVTAAIWQGTHHFKTFTELPRRKEANQIARKMGLKRIKAGSLCLNCHFTTTTEGDKRNAIAGISCESCHGPGKNYLKVHSEFSGKKKETESDAQRAKRWADSEAGGMIRPHDMYRWAKNCYGCHTVPQEKLVNEGGHPAGSKFELVSWSQGEIRHNVWYNQGKGNPQAAAERKRLMYVLGLAVEIETSLRAVGAATVKASYAVSMAKRAKRAQVRFSKVAKVLSEPEFAQIAAAAKSAKLKLNNGPALNAAADKIAKAATGIAAKYDGSTFAAVDTLIPGDDKYKGKPTR